MKKILAAIAIMAASVVAGAQTTATTTSNFYAAGLSWNSSTSPSVAGTAIYGRALTDGTYAAAIYDVVPTTVRPFVVTSNVGVGIAQKVYTLGKVEIYVPTSAGISWTGTNTGWQWSTGGLAAIPVTIRGKSFIVAPIIRVNKSSVSGGTGYQPIIGIALGKKF